MTRRSSLPLAAAVCAAITPAALADGLSIAPTPEALVALVTPQPANPQRDYKPLRFDEDWRWLKNGSKDPDLFDPIKYVPLQTPDLTLSFGGSARLRYEYKINPGFGATNATNPTRNDDYFLSRAYVHADVRYLTLARVFVEGDFAYIDGNRRNPPPTPNPSDDGDLHQAFLDVSPLDLKKDGFGLTLRAGRQELLFDKHRLVGTLDWANVRRTYDGAAVLLAFEKYKATLFWVRPVPIDAEHFNSTDEETNFAGAHLAHPLFTPDHNFSVFTYYLNRSRDTRRTFTAGSAEFNPDLRAGNTDRVTVGGRAWGKFGTAFDYDLEGGVQVGRYTDNDVFAGYVSTEVGYTFADVWAKPRISVGYDYASGDDKRDGRSNTFDQLFPTGHMYLGYLDFVGRQNINAGNVSLAITPTPELKLWTSWHTFCLADSNDALYNASGQALRFSSAGTAGTYVGNELDVTGTYQLGRHTTLLVGYGIFFPGDFIQNTGRSETAQMVYSSIEFKF
jgi:hypothetical protein